LGGLNCVLKAGNLLHPAPTGFPVAATVTFALLAQPVLVQAGGAQLTADIPSNRPLAGLAIAAAISLALLAEPVLVLAGKPQLFTLSASSAAAIINPDPARSDLDGL
jgi:molybdopterin biosynthesis enzyme